MMNLSIKIALYNLLLSSSLMALDFSLLESGEEKQNRDKPGRSARAEEVRKPDATRGRGRAGGRDRFKAFKEADLDGDKALTFEEFSKMKRVEKIDEAKRRKLFNFLDKDKDGKVQLREIQPREPDWLKALKKQFKQGDTNENGSLDKTEFFALSCFSGKAPEVIAEYFNRLDRNKNKVIERHELKLIGGPRPRPHFDFKKYDVNSSGGLDMLEYSKIPWMSKWPAERRNIFFKRIDSDNNGEISPGEISSAHRMHKPGPPHRGGKGHRPNSKEPRKPRSKGKEARPSPR